MVYDAVVYTESAREHRGSRRQTGRVRAIVVSEANPLLGNPVDVRRRLTVITVASQMVRSQGVQIQEQYAHAFLRGVVIRDCRSDIPSPVLLQISQLAPPRPQW